LALIGPGWGLVRLEILRGPQIPEAAVFGVQVGVYAFHENADRTMHNMQTRYGTAQVIARQGQSTTWRVVVGRETSADNAETLANKIRGAENLPESFVVRLDQ